MKQKKEMAENLNKLYHRVDKLLSRGKFSEVEEIIQRINVAETDPTLLIAYMVITNQAQEKYPETYSKFYNEVCDILEIIGEDVKSNTFGLEPKEFTHE